MNTTIHANVDQVLRRYLLGQLAPEALDGVERRLFSDDRIFWERLCLVEDELADDYAWGRLAGEEKDAFEGTFLCSDERRAKLEFARALKASVERRERVPNPFWHWLRVPVAAPGWAVAVAAVLLLAVVPGVAWRFAASRAPDDIVSAWLSPGQVRDIGQQTPMVTAGAGCRLIRLELEIAPGGYGSYSATLFDVNDGEIETLSQGRLSAADVAGKQAVVLTIPCDPDHLPESEYSVRLRGVSPGRAPEDLGRYTFRVLRQ